MLGNYPAFLQMQLVKSRNKFLEDTHLDANVLLIQTFWYK